MKLDTDKLIRYKLENAKVGDKVIIGNCIDPPLWDFTETTVKSVSQKRGYITLANGSKYKKDGGKIGVGRWGRCYSDNFFECSEDNMQIINSYMEIMRKANGIVKWINDVGKCCFEKLYALPEEKISTLYRALEGLEKVEVR